MMHRYLSLAAACAALAAAAAQAGEPGLLAWWKFDDAAGDVASDSSGRGRHGEVFNADWVKGPFGVALRFKGRGAYVAAPGIEELDGADAFTIEAWVFWEGTGRYPNILTLGRWCPGGAMIFVRDRYCSFRMGRPGFKGWSYPNDWKEIGAPFLKGFELRRWYHLAVTFQRPSIRTYVNGRYVSQARWKFPLAVKGDVLIGRWGTNAGHLGLIDEVKIYNRALSPAEIRTSYAQSAAGRGPAEGKAYEVLAASLPTGPPAWSLENDLARLEFGKRLRLLRVIDKASGANLLAQSSSWASLRTRARNWRPSAFRFEKGRLSIQFGAGGSAVLRVRVRPRYFVFEVESVRAEDAQLLMFMNLLAKPAKYVHRMPGLAADDEFALCLRCLNLKARPVIGGRPPVLRAVCQPQYGLKGAAAALVAGPKKLLLPALKDMARGEDVPRSPLGGPFAFDAPLNRASYLFASGLTEADVDEWIDMAQTACIPFVHLSSWYRSQGHYEPRPTCFPRGMASLKAVVARIHDAGLLAGMHTLTGCIQPHDPFVTPKPDPRLFKDRTFTLAAATGPNDETLYVNENPRGLNVVWNYSSRGNVVQIGEELVQFRGLKTTPPYALTRCLRGHWGTTARAHPKGEKAYHLFARYGAFQPDPNSSLVDDVAKCIADKVNEAGFDLIYHDGAEGMPDRAYGAAKMRTAIYTRIRRPIRVESSWSSLHHCWWFHSCVGAWDHPQWGLKRCVDEHVKRNIPYRERSLMPAQLGWWAILGPAWWHDAEWPDEVEYLCVKALANDMSLSFQGLRPQGWSARQGEYLKLIGRYEKLRLSGYFSDAVKARLREPRREFRLVQAADGEWMFAPVDYLSRKVVASDPARRRWTVTNRFAAQTPRLRIQALYAADEYDSPDGMTLAAFEKPHEFRAVRAARGVSHSLRIVTAPVKVGKTSARLAAKNTTRARVAAWARFEKKFLPDLNLRRCRALGVWVYGDGKGEVLNFQLRSPQLYHGCWDEHIIKIDFTGWRYFELLLRERTADEHYDYQWPYGHAMRICRTPLVTSHVSELNIYFNNLPPGEEAVCYVSPIRALPMVKTTQRNPRLVVNGRRILFPAALESGQYIEFTSMSDCVLRDEAGAVIDRVAPRGAAPRLASGANTVEFESDAPAAPTPRARVTIIPSGKPFGGIAKGKEGLKRKFRRLDDYFLRVKPPGRLLFLRRVRKVIRRLDGKDNAWTVANDSNRPQPILEARVRVGGPCPGDAYARARALAEFEDAAAFAGRERHADWARGPRRRGLAKEGVTAAFSLAPGAPVGRFCGRLTARSEWKDRSGWAAVVRAFPKPLDLSGTTALGLWVKGDGKGASLRVQLRDAAGAAADYYVPLDSTAWRYVELPRPAMGRVDRRRVVGVVFYLLALRGRATTTCWIDGVRALPRPAARAVVNARLVIGSSELRIPGALREGDLAVIRRSGRCERLRRGAAAQPLRVQGAPPLLPPGRTRVRFACDGPLSNEVQVTFVRP